MSAQQLAEQLDVSKTTIGRDLATLERHFPIIEESAGKQKRLYRLDRKVRALETMTFGVSELLAIYAALAGLASLEGTPIHEDLEEVRFKIRGALAPHHSAGLDLLQEVFASHKRGFVDYSEQGERIDDLLDAIARRRVCDVTYHAAWKGTVRTHKVRPLRLVWHRSSLYLLARLGEHTRITTLAVHRIQKLAQTEDVFDPPRGRDLDKHISRAFGIFVSDREEDVEVRFDAGIAWRIEEQTFHPRETKERQPDQSLIYRVRSSAQWEIIPWVRSFGALAELLTPAAWRDVLHADLEAAAGRYRSKQPIQ